MKKYLLFFPVLGIGLLANAQEALKDNKLNRYLQDRPVVMQHNAASTTPVHHQQRSGARNTSILNSQRIGSAGNLLSIIENTCNQIDVDQSLQTVVFIHRNDPTNYPGTNVAQYRFDRSKNLGLTWTSDIGPITNDASIDNITVNGRFPQGVIYNPAGNTIADSAYLVYSGTWHNGEQGSWIGQMRGRGKISGDTSTFNVHIDQLTGNPVSIAAGMCKGAPGVFWNLNVATTGTFSTSSDQIITALLVQKGVWNPTTKDVDWTLQTINQTFASTFNSVEQSTATSWNIAFDPSGRYGWISVLGDVTLDNDSVYDPIFWQSTDSGATWQGPIHVDLDQIQGLTGTLSPVLVDGSTPTTMVASTAFESDMTVDANGNPHLLTTVGSGTEYSIQTAGYGVWDITYDANAMNGCQWKGIHLADIVTLRGTFSSDNPAQTEDNRPLVSRSADGNKIFFFWLESDADFLGSTDNDIPNMFGRGIDVAQSKMTQLYNFTEGDSLWGGETSSTPGGIFQGAIFPTVGVTSISVGNVNNIPLVFTQVDYQNGNGGLGSSENPAAFWYVNNLNIPNADFTEQLDQVAPTITLNGTDTVTVLVNTTYTEDGATALDCTDGVINPTVTGSVDTAHVGIYLIQYVATDAAGNSDTVIRTVIVGAIPVADFTWGFPNTPGRAVFTDQSANLPSNWQWNYGDGTGSNGIQNPSHQYTAIGDYNVCLVASNSFGTSASTCKLVNVASVSVGINETAFADQISLYPNPTTGVVRVNVEGAATGDFTVTVYNVLGEVVLPAARYKAGTTNVDLNMTEQLNGMYMVKLQGNQGTAVKQLVVNHK